MTPRNVLISWIGRSDLRSAAKDARRSDDQAVQDLDDPGPVLRLLREVPFDQVHLLNDIADDAVDSDELPPTVFRGWIERRVRGMAGHPPCEVVLRSASRNLFADYEGAYNYTRDEIAALRTQLQDAAPDVEFSLLLTPGYLPCQVAMLIASQVLFRGKVRLFNTIFQGDSGPGRRNLVTEVDLPFSLKLDLHPKPSPLLRKLIDDSLDVWWSPPRNDPFATSQGDSAVWVQVIQKAKQFASSGRNILILGETGTGKELMANAIHAASSRRDAPLLDMNCAAHDDSSLLMSELFGHEKGAFTGADETRLGLLERAHGGTLFWDEVGETSSEFQKKLLRAFQEKKFRRMGGNRDITTDFRLICATNRKWEELKGGEFHRSGFFTRIAEVVIELPPLRERDRDAAMLAKFFLHQADAKAVQQPENSLPANRASATVSPFTEEAEDWFCVQHWPGNVRELRNFVCGSLFYLAVTSPVIGVAELEAAREYEHPSQDRQSSRLRALSDASFLDELSSMLRELKDRRDVDKSFGGQLQQRADASPLLHTLLDCLESPDAPTLESLRGLNGQEYFSELAAVLEELIVRTAESKSFARDKDKLPIQPQTDALPFDLTGVDQLVEDLLIPVLRGRSENVFSGWPANQLARLLRNEKKNEFKDNTSWREGLDKYASRFAELLDEEYLRQRRRTD